MERRFAPCSGRLKPGPPPRWARMKTLLFALLLASTLALAGCTDGGDDESTTNGGGSEISGETTVVGDDTNTSDATANSTNETASSG